MDLTWSDFLVSLWGGRVYTAHTVNCGPQKSEHTARETERQADYCKNYRA